MCGKGRHWETHTVSLGCRVLFLTDDGQAELDKLFIDGGEGAGEGLPSRVLLRANLKNKSVSVASVLCFEARSTQISPLSA